MKKKYLFLLLSLSFTVCTFAQNSVRVYNLDVKMGHNSDIARNFADYWDVEYKTGGMILQSVSFLEGVTHRVIASGDPSNWGTKIEKSQSEWQAHLSKQRLHLNDAEGSMVMTNLKWRREGDWERSKASKYWEIIPKDPDKFVKAYDKFMKGISDILDWRVTSLASIDMGGLGGTHSTSLKGEDMNDLILIEREIQKTKAFQDFLEERGEVEIIKSYFGYYVHRFR